MRAIATVVLLVLIVPEIFGADLTVRVIDGAGNLVSQAAVRVQRVGEAIDPNRPQLQPRTDQSGVFHFRRLEPGRYAITAQTKQRRSQGRAEQRVRIREAAEEHTAVLQLQYFPTYAISGVIHGVGSRIQENPAVFVQQVERPQPRWGTPPDCRASLVQPDGAFSVAGLPAGEYRVRLARLSAGSEGCSPQSAELGTVLVARDTDWLEYYLFP